MRVLTVLGALSAFYAVFVQILRLATGGWSLVSLMMSYGFCKFAQAVGIVEILLFGVILLNHHAATSTGRVFVAL